MLGKDVVATFANKIIPKMAAHAEKKGTFVVKLRVALETLHYLTKPSKYPKLGYVNLHSIRGRHIYIYRHIAVFSMCIILVTRKIP